MLLAISLTMNVLLSIAAIIAVKKIKKLKKIAEILIEYKDSTGALIKKLEKIIISIKNDIVKDKK